MQFPTHAGDDYQPTWLLSGQEGCHFCGHAYLLEMTYYCVECDAPICPLCIVELTAGSQICCPACALERGEKGVP